MGADIHVYVLKNDPETNKMYEICLYTKDLNGEMCKAYIGEHRNYALFSKLAGVRGCEDPISGGHDGFINNCPKLILCEYENWNGHSPVWFSWDTLKLAAKYEGMTQYNDFENYNVVEDWIKELEVILNVYYIFDTENIYVQIFFDN